MTVIYFILTIVLLIFLIWNIALFYRHKNQSGSNEHKYFELDAKLNFIIASASFSILVISYLGWDVKGDIMRKSEEPIKEMIDMKSKEIDSLLDSKNILKANIYIINDMDFKEDSAYRFKDLLTIDNKYLPDFVYKPKLLISTSTGENLRIEKITNEYFILGRPILKNGFRILEEDNPKYPKTVKFDVWIADYKSK